MLTRNIWAEKGLCNGSLGYIKHIIFKEGQCPPNLPLAVIVKFDAGYIGPSILSEERCVSIIPITSTGDVLGANYERQQLPLKLAWSITIHKSQGLTLDKAWVNLGSKENCAGLAYVALSRVRTLSDLLVEPMTLERLQAVARTSNYAYRIKEEERLNNLAQET